MARVQLGEGTSWSLAGQGAPVVIIPGSDEHQGNRCRGLEIASNDVRGLDCPPDELERLQHRRCSLVEYG